MTDQYANQWNSEERSKACFDEKQSSCKDKNTPTKKKKKKKNHHIWYIDFLLEFLGADYQYNTQPITMLHCSTRNGGFI
ncbi:unnamed protein product, partial [Vitis vinifera]